MLTASRRSKKGHLIQGVGQVEEVIIGGIDGKVQIDGLAKNACRLIEGGFVNVVSSHTSVAFGREVEGLVIGMQVGKVFVVRRVDRALYRHGITE